MAEVKKPRKPRSDRGRRGKALKIDDEKVKELAAKGLTTTEIAKHQGVNPSTIWRFLQQFEGDRKAVEEFKSHRADVLASLQAKSLQLQRKIIESYEDGDIIALKPQEKNGLLLALNAQHGTSFDKERLERGQSTSNQSIVSRMIDSTVKDIYKLDTQVLETTKGRTPK